MKCEDIILSDFLSRKRTDNSNPHQIIPIAFDMHTILKDRYYNIGNDSRYLVQMQSQAKASGIKLLEVHSVDKVVDPNVKPERQILKCPNLTTQPNVQNRPRLWQGRAGLRRKMKAPIQVQTQVQPRDVSQIKEQTLPKQKEDIQTPLTKSTTDRHVGQMPETCIMPEHTIRPKVTETQIPIYPDPLMKTLPRPSDVKMQDGRKINLYLDLEINKDFEENSLYQEGMISEIYQRPGKSQLLEPPELVDLINTNNIVQKYLPKQHRYRQNLDNYTKESIEGYTSPCNNKGHTSGISKQSIFQRFIFVPSVKQIAKFQECYT